MTADAADRRYDVGVDIGGTFTDVVVLDRETGRTSVAKVLTTPEDPSLGAVSGVWKALLQWDLPPERVSHVIHGTTLVANAIIERKGARVGLLTTDGFRDVLEIGREKRYDIYDLFIDLPEPLVPRHLRLGVPERLDKDGRVVRPLDRRAAAKAIAELKAAGVEAVAVCLLHSFRNPAHEEALKGLLYELMPGAHVSLSSEVMPEIREYERTSTTVANAYVQPLARGYLERVAGRLEEMGVGGSLYLMLSDGGLATVGTAARFPVRIVESGPAGGALLAALHAEMKRQPDILAFDMGGTTAKVCFITGGRPTRADEFEAARVYRFKKGSGLPLKVPVIEMVEIGAGGGSIARLDSMGLIRVGPESAGAVPGPICYGRGGRDPTVTDADLALGYLSSGFFLGGEMALDLEGARAGLGSKVAAPLGIDPVAAAWGIHETVNENMASAARVHAAERGLDLSRYALLAFGGAGPVHAYGVASKLRMNRVICPPAAGVASAFGFLAAPLSFQFVQAHMAQLELIDFECLNGMLEGMRRKGVELLAASGVDEARITVDESAGMRYSGQGYEIDVPLPEGELGPASLPELRRRFEERYRQLYGRLNPDVDVEALTWRVVVSGPKPPMRLTAVEGGGDPGGEAAKGSRPVFFPEAGGFVVCPVYDRYLLRPDQEIEGPAVVEERESTCVVGPGARAAVDPLGNLVLELASAGPQEEGG